MIGIDEVGRGAWAGPLLVVAARERDAEVEGLADSKILSRLKREKLTPLIKASCDIGEGWVSATEVDELGLTAAMRLGVSRALGAIDARSEEIIIMDGNINYCAVDFVRVRTIINADKTHPIVSAASIYAKVTRDSYMTDLSQEFPQYGFDAHVGYGTAFHSAVLLQYGVTSMHRKSFKPIKSLL